MAAEPPLVRSVARPPQDGRALSDVLGQNLRDIRTKRGLSLQRLASASGVSRAMLGQIELGHSAPTIHVLWKIAHALRVPLSALITDPAQADARVLTASTTRLLTSHDGALTSRALLPRDGGPRTVEFYELRLAGGASDKADVQPPGTKGNLVVAEGALTMIVRGKRYALSSGDAIAFEADWPHEYRNEGPEPLRMFLVMTYSEIGR